MASFTLGGLLPSGNLSHTIPESREAAERGTMTLLLSRGVCLSEDSLLPNPGDREVECAPSKDQPVTALPEQLEQLEGSSQVKMNPTHPATGEQQQHP